MGAIANEHSLSSNFAIRLQIRQLETYQSRSKIFSDAQRNTTENALTDLYIYLIGTKFVETADTPAFRQTVVTLCQAVSFKNIKHLPNIPSK